MNPFKKVFLFCWKSSEKRRLKRQIIRKYKHLPTRRHLSKEQKKEIQDFYLSTIGRKIPLYMHQYFYSRNGIFSKYYIPDTVYTVDLLPKANDRQMTPFLTDKNFTDILLPVGENVVHSVLKNINGYYYFEDQPVSPDEAVSRCSNLKEVIIKPSKTSKGKGILLFSATDGITDIQGKTVAQLFKDYNRDFLIQHRVRQHKEMAALNPTSLNTLRILSYRSGMEILIIYTVARIGRMNQVVDNQSAGGLCTPVSPQGTLGKYSFGTAGSDLIEQTDTGIKLEGYQIPSYDKAIEFVKRLHYRLPNLNIVGWDVAIGEDGEPILIEFNVGPGLSQTAFGSGLGQYTERIIKELWPRLNTKYRI